MLRTVAGLTLTAAGMVVFGYAMYLELIRPVPLSWWERTLLLSTMGLTAMVAGLLVVVR